LVFEGQFCSLLQELNPRAGLGVYLRWFGSSEGSVLPFSVFREIYPEWLWACNNDTLSDVGGRQSISNHIEKNSP